MSTTINEQNALRIRQPMSVIVTLTQEQADASALSASASGEKIANLTDITSTYYLRKLADLQGDGFPLDGSAVVYDPTVPDSEADGKIGVRGDIGDDFYVTVTSSTTILNLSVVVSGSDYVYFNNKGYVPQDGVVLLPVNASSATFRVYSETENNRAVVQYVLAGVYLTFTNANLLSCELNLRSDLSPIDPTLPESEIVIRAHVPGDLSEVAANILDDQPITYQAGYDVDLSPVRYFYLSEPIECKEHEITIHGVDAVHLLDAEMPSFFLGKMEFSNGELDNGFRRIRYNASQTGAHRMLAAAVVGLAQKAGVVFTSVETMPATTIESNVEGKYQKGYFEADTARNTIANLMNLVRFDYTGSYFSTLTSFYLNYVDAGRPKFTYTKPSSTFDIYESDCGSIKKNVARKIGAIYAENNQSMTATAFYERNMYGVGSSGYRPRNCTKVGTLDLLNGEGGAVNLDLPCIIATAKVTDGNGTWFQGMKQLYTSNGPHEMPQELGAIINSTIYKFGIETYDGNCFEDWNAGLRFLWENAEDWNIVDSGEDQVSFPVYGNAFMINDSPTTYTGSGGGVQETASSTRFTGIFDAGKYNAAGTRKRLLPTEGFKQLFKRSQETGSFTWKGDPRMQPRDVFTFHYLDGATELRTVENITLKHEGGGTIAEITYRKGIV